MKKKIKKTIRKHPLTYSIARRAKKIIYKKSNNETQEIYDYLKQYPSKTDLEIQKNESAKFKYSPLISIIVPTYNTNIAFLEECIESVLNQSYPNWELCIADDASPNREVIDTINEYLKIDSRIKLMSRSINGHISIASNSGIEISNGEFIALLDHDDVLWPNALFEIIKLLNEDKSIDFIYTDEDKIDENSTYHSYPFFKPDWSPEFLESCNYITHFSCIRRSIIDDISGFRKGYEGAQDWDLFIRVTEKTNKIKHIPKVLYSWRVHSGSTSQDTDAKPYVYEAQKKLLKDHVHRLKRLAKIETGLIWQHSVIKYEPLNKPQITLLHIGKDYKLIKKSIKKSGYKKLNMHSIENATSIKIALKNIDTDYVILLGDNTEIVSNDWVKLMLGDCQIEGVGSVGGILFNKSKEIIVSAGIGVNSSRSYIELLRDCKVEDNHYMRALYGKSRRNVAANTFPLMIKVSKLNIDNIVITKNTDDLAVDISLDILSHGYRNVYTPYVESIKYDYKNNDNYRRSKLKNWSRKFERDPYFNENYDKSNGSLKVLS